MLVLLLGGNLISIKLLRVRMRWLILLLILLVIPIQVNLTSSEGSWWNEEWYYRIPIVVTSGSETLEGIVSVEINLTKMFQELNVDGEPDIGSIRIVHGSSEVPFTLSFSRESKIDDLEGSLDNWEFSSHIVSERVEDAAQGSYSLKFRKGTIEEARNVLKLDQKTLRESNIISFLAKGNFTAILRDKSFPKEISRTEVSSNEYRRYFIQYNPELLSEGREYILSFAPRDYFSYNFVDDVKFVSGNVVAKWSTSIPAGERKVFYLYFNALDKEFESLPLYNVQGAEKEFSVELGNPEGFRAIIELQEGSIFSGIIEVRAKVLENLSNIVKVQYRVDYSENLSWDANWGLLGEMKFEQGEWVGELDTTRAYDGLHVITVKAFEESGRTATANVMVYFRNVQYEEPVNLNPSAEEFTFCVLGDNRPGSSKSPMPRIFWQIVRAICDENPDMVFNTGDIVYAGEFKEYIRFREVVSLLNVPLFIARGNHEVSIGKAGEENYRHFFDVPGFSYNSYYSFDYGNSHFIILNANIQEHKYSVDEPQLSWFINDMEAHKDSEHIFIFVHQPIYEYAHGLENETSERTLEETIEKNAFYPHRIYVFQGHEHLYYNSSQNNVMSYITGGGGAELDPQYPDETLFFHFLKVTVRGSEVNVEVIRPLVLEINEPKSNVTYSSEPYLRIKGRAQTNCRLTINEKEVSILPAGVFESRFKLSVGKNEVVVRVEDPNTGESLTRKIIAYYKPTLEVNLPDRLASGSELRVKVTSLGSPVEGVALMINDQKAITDTSGYAKIVIPSVTEEKRLVFVATKEGYTDFVRVVTISPAILTPYKWLVLAIIVVIAVLLIFRLMRKRS
ncbi:MAG: hypothetical protein DRN90_05820 [Thermoproteota archaeon]|nr:MAG: hypothetical protein DRN90_05820 [Candidatus Korarchaeota archaeon]